MAAVLEIETRQAIHRFFSIIQTITLIIQHPEYKELFISHLVGLLTTDTELEAITALHIINIIVINYRLTVRDNSDAFFLGKLFDMGGELRIDYD